MSTAERQAAVDRAGGRCEECGGGLLPKGERRHSFEVHHIQRSTNGGLDCLENLAILCLECHDKTRGRPRLTAPSRPHRHLIPLDDPEEEELLRLVAQLRVSRAAVVRQALKELAVRLSRLETRS